MALQFFPKVYPRDIIPSISQYFLNWILSLNLVPEIPYFPFPVKPPLVSSKPRHSAFLK